jgi:hypothetical protein
MGWMLTAPMHLTRQEGRALMPESAAFPGLLPSLHIMLSRAKDLGMVGQVAVQVPCPQRGDTLLSKMGGFDRLLQEQIKDPNNSALIA